MHKTLFGSLQANHLPGMRLRSWRETNNEAIDWRVRDNSSRLNSRPGYMSPEQYGQDWLVINRKQGIYGLGHEVDDSGARSVD